MFFFSVFIKSQGKTASSSIHYMSPIFSRSWMEVINSVTAFHSEPLFYLAWQLCLLQAAAPLLQLKEMNRTRGNNGLISDLHPYVFLLQFKCVLEQETPQSLAPGAGGRSKARGTLLVLAASRQVRPVMLASSSAPSWWHASAAHQVKWNHIPIKLHLRRGDKLNNLYLAATDDVSQFLKPLLYLQIVNWRRDEPGMKDGSHSD